MSLVPFDTLPDEARLWCFGCDRMPTAAETARILDRVSSFLATWTAHGEPLDAALEWRHRRFLLVAVDESRASASGCSIDGLVSVLKDLERDLGLRLLDASPVWYRDDTGRIRCVSREEFQHLAGEGGVGPGTVVYDLSVTRVGDLRTGRWEGRAAESWHARLLPTGR